MEGAKMKKIGMCFFLTVLIFIGIYFYVNQQVMVSVVLPTYNREKYFKRSLDSLMTQTYKNFEVIVVDDGSTDGTSNLLKEYQKKFKNLKIVTHEKNLGVSQARNTGNRYAKGKYIAIMDSDDFAMPDFLEKTVDFMEKNSSVTIGIPPKNKYKPDEEDDFLNPTTHRVDYPLYWIVGGNYFSNVGNIFRRDFILKKRIEYNAEYTCGEDYDFWVQMILKGAVVSKIPSDTHLIVFRERGGLSSDLVKCRETNAIIQKKIHKSVDYHSEFYENDRCAVAQKLLKKYPNVFLEQELDKIEKMCPLKTDVFIKLIHPFYHDYFIFEKNPRKGYRKITLDSAQILSFHPNKEITINWDKWNKETFIYNEQYGVYILKKE